MKYCTIAAIAALSLGACAAEAKPPSDLSFLAGYWLSCADDQVSETWTDTREGVTLGLNFSTGHGKPS